MDLRDSAPFSACNAASGPFFPSPVPLECDYVTALIKQCRDQLPMGKLLRSKIHLGTTSSGRSSASAHAEAPEFMGGLADHEFADEFALTSPCQLVELVDLRQESSHTALVRSQASRRSRRRCCGCG